MDLACVILSVPVALEIYRLLISDQMILPVHLFAVCAAAGTYLLIRMSRHAYDRTLVNSFDLDADSLIDAVASVLIASAVVWQLGMIRILARTDDPLSDRVLPVTAGVQTSCSDIDLRLAASGSIEQRIAFYGADPASLAIIRKVLDGIDLPHLRFVGVADDRPRVKKIEGLPLIGGLKELLALARSGELDQVLFCVPNLPPKRLQDIMEELSSVSVDVAVIPAEVI